MAFRLEIVTPEKRIFSDDVEGVVIPGSEGELGILENHAPLLTNLQPGELRYTKGGKDETLVIGKGAVEVTRTKVSVMTDLAVTSDEIDEAAVEEALKRAEDALAEKMTDEEIATVEASIQKSLAQLTFKRKRRTQI
ncbi:MAG: ATP synthase F1 subunit epsilon [Verrucomicrobiales bacterium]|nr:ATP synthase F1 subunit epsilon [Verrucomicrobiales bacterium]